jgi:hypothetical protein
MQWMKRGLVIGPDGGPPWAMSHAMLPVAEPIAGGKVRVYYATRDERGRSRVARAEVDFPPQGGTPHSTVESEPVISLGPLGAFDDNGVTCSALVSHRDRHYLYYSGWSLGQTVPFYIFIGCAVSEDGGRTFRKVSPSPIVERNPIDPYLAGHPSVMVDGGVWRMWYASGTGWTMVNGKPRHHYHIKYAESADGLEWRREGRVCIDYAGPEEYALGRPFVVRDRDVYRMWFSKRGDSYRIGYAESDDGLDWRRMDSEVGIDVSPEGWDSEMVEYPCVFDAGGRRWMLYNGNGYGRTGIGLAELRG